MTPTKRKALRKDALRFMTVQRFNIRRRLADMEARIVAGRKQDHMNSYMIRHETTVVVRGRA